MSKSQENDVLRHSSCSFDTDRSDPNRRNTAEVLRTACDCEQGIKFQHGGALFNPWLRNKLSRSGHKGTLVGYVRTTGDECSIEPQLKQIEDYCQEHGFKLLRVLHDHGIPGRGLQEALNSLDECGGIITTDLQKLTDFHQNHLREVRPLVHHFLSHTDKHLISINEGIDTRSAAGQMAAIELISDMKREF
jgi:DNA-binding LacI/PurR family transcriptional regulator